MTEDLIKKLNKRINNNIEVLPVYKNSELKTLLNQFLESQDYLRPKKILSIINISFLEDSPIGYILYKDQKKIVGFLGTIFSKRKIQKDIISHCYLHSWIVNSDFRTQAFRLVLPILEKKIFISTYSPINSLEGLYKKLNFKEKSFKSKLIISFPLKSFNNKKANLTDDQSLFQNLLSEDLKKICNDHASLNNNLLFVYFDHDINDNILIIVKKKFKKIFLPVLEIIYVSNFAKFKNNRKNIIFELFKKFRTFIFLENFFNDQSIFDNKNFLYKETKKNAYYKNVPNNFKYDLLYSELLE